MCIVAPPRSQGFTSNWERLPLPLVSLPGLKYTPYPPYTTQHFLILHTQHNTSPPSTPFSLHSHFPSIHTPFPPLTPSSSTVPFPPPRHFFLTDPSTNSVLGWAKASLVEAEAFGFEHPEALDGFAFGTLSSVTAAAADNGVGGGKAATLEEGEDGAAAAKAPLVPKALATASKFISRYGAGKQHKGGEDAGALALAGPEPYDPEEAGQLIEINFMAPSKCVGGGLGAVHSVVVATGVSELCAKIQSLVLGFWITAWGCAFGGSGCSPSLAPSPRPALRRWSKRRAAGQLWGQGQAGQQRLALFSHWRALLTCFAPHPLPSLQGRQVRAAAGGHVRLLRRLRPHPPRADQGVSHDACGDGGP